MVNKKNFAIHKTCLSYFHERNTGKEERERERERERTRERHDGRNG